MRNVSFVLALVLGGTACTAAEQGSGGGDSASMGAVEEDRLTQQAAQYRSFEKINAAPIRTAQHQGQPDVNVWANDLAAATYRGINPSGSDSASFPVGSMLVKEMLLPEGTVLTVMAKRPPGYDPDNADWWFARLDGKGTPTGVGLVGRVSFCIACHAGAARTDRAFGGAAASR